MFCSNCGNQLKSNSYFCGKCGQIVFFNVVRAAKNKNQDAIALLIQNTQKKLYYTAFRILNDEAAAEDIIQESYIKAFSDLDTLKDENKFNSWLTTIVINRCKNYLSIKKNTHFMDFSQLDDPDNDLTEENVNKFLVLLYRSCSNLHKDELVDASYIYYLLKNISMLNYINDHSSKAADTFSVELISNIKAMMYYIMAKEEEFYASNKSSGSRK